MTKSTYWIRRTANGYAAGYGPEPPSSLSHNDTTWQRVYTFTTPRQVADWLHARLKEDALDDRA